jgi:NAD dependent epimerase/dehydratase family enzyme
LHTESLRGPVNAVAPQQVDFRFFADNLARLLRRPRYIDVPPWILRPVLGAKSQLLLEGSPVVPRSLLENGFIFLLPELNLALKHELGIHEEWTPPQFETEEIMQKVKF